MVKKMPAGFHTIKVDLLPGHCRRLADGEAITVKHDMMGKGIPVVVHHTTAKKLMAAHKKGKGMRLGMSPQEVEMSGGKITWKKFTRGLKKGWQFYRKNLSKIFGPLVKQGLQTLSAAAGAELGPGATIAGNKLIEGLASTGLYGDDGDGSTPSRAAAPAPVATTPATAAPVATTPAARPAQRGYSVGGAGIRKRATRKPRTHMSGGAMFLQPFYGAGLYSHGSGLFSGGSIYAPSNFIPHTSPVMTRLVDIGNTQYGSHLIPIPL